MQAGKAISMPASAILYGILVIVSFTMSHSAVQVEGTLEITGCCMVLCIKIGHMYM